MKTLKQAAIGDTVKVVKLHGEGAVKRRIMDMGILRMNFSWPALTGRKDVITGILKKNGSHIHRD